MFELLTGRGIANFRSSDAFFYLFKSYTILGSNPPKDTGPLYYIWSILLNGSIIFILPIVCVVGSIIQYARHDIGTMRFLNGIQAGLNVLGMPPKIIIMALSLNRLRSIEPTLAAMDARYKKPEDVALIRRSALMGNRMISAVFIAYMCYMLFSLMPNVIKGGVPFGFWIPFLDWNRSRIDFLAQSVVDVFFFFFSLYYQALNDTYGAVYIYVIRAHLQLLRRRVQQLGTDAEMSSEDKMEELVDCIVTHQQILELVAVVEPVISKTIFTQFLIFASILCVTMINIFIFADLSTQISATVYLLCVLLQTSPCCYYATQLMTESEKLPDDIFHCNWVDQDRCFRKAIIYFMHHSQRSIEIKAMKLFTINMATNVSIAKFSFTLYAFIKQMGIGQNAND
ncbi:odorant receptor 7a-like [Rhagoletis pomonella]|uniref:odorant receptor 7a-like n=1 Tax=Rhagoletis pomonella TaxID=28610 RepID=UPI0017837301|nr:odorant receptor 7a-like [Rhagoletis pomonella]